MVVSAVSCVGFSLIINGFPEGSAVFSITSVSIILLFGVAVALLDISTSLGLSLLRESALFTSLEYVKGFKSE